MNVMDEYLKFFLMKIWHSFRIGGGELRLSPNEKEQYKWDDSKSYVRNKL